MRFGVPRLVVAVVTLVLTSSPAWCVSPLVAIAMFVGVPVLLLVVPAGT